MERFVKGDAVVVPFPFSDLSTSKKRPALVVTNLAGEDIILCQITSGSRIDEHSISLDDTGFRKGGLSRSSIIRPNRLFTADRSIISYKAGTLTEAKCKEVEEELVRIFTA